MNGMSYEMFRNFRKTVERERHPLRLDCMNPVKSLSSEIPRRDKRAHPLPPASRDRVLGLWREHWGKDLPDKRFVINESVRSILEEMFHGMRSSGHFLAMPNDAYPLYFDLAEKCGIRCRGFSTMPGIDWTFLSRMPKKACLLFPHPLTPAGRRLDAKECDVLDEWLGQSSDRWLLLDAVYEYDFLPSSTTNRLIETGRTTLVHSLSKGWLSPRTFAVAVSPDALPQSLQIPDSPLTPGQRETACWLLSECSDKPGCLQKIFRRRWEKLKPVLYRLDTAWEPPASGYFSFLRVSADTLLQDHNTLAIPPSVFGADLDNFSIVTCLHESLGDRP